MWLLSPLTWLVLSGVLLFPALRLRARWPVGICMTVTAIALTGMTPLVANLLVARLERPARADKNCALRPPPTIVVLAGGLEGKPRDTSDFSVLSIASRRRLERAVQYWRRGDGRTLVLTGTSSDSPMLSDAMIMAVYAGVFDVPGNAIRIESRAHNTWENARQVAAMMPRVPRRITLVTSGMHMRRATFAFRAAGFLVCPLPADSRLAAVKPPGYLVPRSSSLRKTEDGLYELVGFAYYYWRNRLGVAPALVRHRAGLTDGLAGE